MDARAPPPKRGLVALNLLSLVLAGVTGSAWILWYTDYFPVVGGLLGLGGLFAWIAFLSNLIADRRKAQIQEWFDSVILQSNWFFVALCTALGVALLGFGPCSGTILLDSLEESAAHVVEVREVHNGKRSSQRPLRRIALPPYGQVKVLLPTGWFGSRNYHVKISGLPADSIAVSAWGRIRVLVPDTFQERAVLLARPAASIVSSLVDQNYKFRLQILLNEQQLGSIDDYRGEAIWIGGDDDVKIPPAMVERWRFEFIAEGLSPAEVSRWMSPGAVAPDLVLPPSSTVKVNVVRLTDSNEMTVYMGRAIISKSGRGRHFPEEVVVDGQ